MKHGFVVLFILGVMGSFIVAESLTKPLYDQSNEKLREAILVSIRKHALYSYNIANATTPGFKPILFPEDEQELSQIIPEGQPYSDKVVIEHLSAKLAENSRRHAAYYALYKKKIDNLRQVVTLGKK